MHSSIMKSYLVFSSLILVAYTAPQVVELKPLSAQLNAESRAYAAAYPYGAAQIGTAITKTVHYADTPTVVGYAPTVYKPDLSAYAAGSFPQVEQLRRFNPGVRQVQTVVPKVTAVEPSVVVQKVPYDVQVPVPVEYRPSVAVVTNDVAPPPYYYTYVHDRK
ncbi:uncharacterized protein LOC126904685 [Daktulosphaira vitifoliae]|uniref:uncharacterized protein LOC126904685 n=1 Tax=Daktulosphaira vitifoliae TaxID=58002 RepID=UPI0021AAFE5F|nr:uncharacterized protein LOC126904685 [Daktulosphaira vitifoliae]